MKARFVPFSSYDFITTHTKSCIYLLIYCRISRHAGQYIN